MVGLSGKPKLRFAARVIVYCVGLWLMAFGAAFAINSRLGVAPKSSLSFVLSVVLKVNVGYCVTALSIVHLIIQMLILRKDFQAKSLLQIIPSALFGYLIDLSRWIIGDFCFSTYFGQLCMLLFSSFLVGLGVTLYVSAKLVLLTAEGLCMTISKKYHFKFHNVKNAQDILSVCLAVLCSFLFLRKLVGVREGTVILALLNGRFVKYTQILVRRLIPNGKQLLP